MKRRAFAISLLLFVLIALCVVPALTVEAAPSQQGTNPGTGGLVACWDLEEASGTRTDAFGSEDLTDNNTVLQGTGLVGFAADFERSNSEYLSRADGAPLSTGDIDWLLVGYVNFESIGTDQVIVGKYSGASDEYLLRLSPSNNISLLVFNGATSAIASVSSSGTVSTGTWYQIEAWHNAAANEVGLRINSGTPDTAATSGAGGDGTATFSLGAIAGSAIQPLDGLEDTWSYWERGPFSDDESDWYWNGGAGRQCSDLVAAPTATPTDTPTNTPTATGTSTPTATPTVTPTSTNTPTPEYEWIGTLPSSGREYRLSPSATYGDIGIVVFLIVVAILLCVLILLEMHPRKRARQGGHNAIDL